MGPESWIGRPSGVIGPALYIRKEDVRVWGRFTARRGDTTGRAATPTPGWDGGERGATILTNPGNDTYGARASAG